MIKKKIKKQFLSQILYIIKKNQPSNIANSGKEKIFLRILNENTIKQCTVIEQKEDNK